MPLPRFELARPRSVAEATRLCAEAGPQGRAIAGGTDLLVAMKHGLEAPRLLVALGGIDELRGTALEQDGVLRIGAGERLAAVASNPLVRQRAPLLAEACARVGHPQVRAMGTLGGNVCLDVRCPWVDRTAFWRGALGGCLKVGGNRCHVVQEGRRCVAAASGDTLAPLVALGAEVEIAGPSGTRRLPVLGLRAADGRAPLSLGPAEIVVAVRIPSPPARRLGAYLKWAVRRAIDFPLVSVALVCDLGDDRRVADLRVAVGVLGPRPRLVRGLERLRGERLGPAVAEVVAAEVFRQCVPLPNVLYDAEYRRRLLGVLVRRQLEAWASGLATG